MSLKDFAKTDPYHGWRNEEVLKEDKQTKEENKNMTEKDVRDAIGEYSKLSNDQLMAELVKHMAIKRQNGELGSVKETIKKIEPFLNTEQKKRMSDIVDKLGI